MFEYAIALKFQEMVIGRTILVWLKEVCKLKSIYSHTKIHRPASLETLSLSVSLFFWNKETLITFLVLKILPFGIAIKFLCFSTSRKLCPKNVSRNRMCFFWPTWSAVAKQLCMFLFSFVTKMLYLFGV